MIGSIEVSAPTFQTAVKSIPFLRRDPVTFFYRVSNLEVCINRYLLNYFNNDSHGLECCFIIGMFNTHVAKYLAPDILQNNSRAFFVSLLLSSTVTIIHLGNSEDGLSKQTKSV